MRHERSVQQSLSRAQLPPMFEQVQSLVVYCQSPQEPTSGPAEPPTMQWLVEPHQPHSARPVQSPQFGASPQGSADTHSDESHAQSPEHDPVLGPDEVPERQAPSHHPHGYVPVQLAQSV